MVQIQRFKIFLLFIIERLKDVIKIIEAFETFCADLKALKSNIKIKEKISIIIIKAPSKLYIKYESFTKGYKIS